LKLEYHKLLSKFAFNCNLRRYSLEPATDGSGTSFVDIDGFDNWILGSAVQVDPMKPTLKAPGTKRLKLEHEKPLSNFA